MADKEPKETEREAETLSLQDDIRAAFASSKTEGVQPDQTIPAAKEAKPAKETKTAKEPKEPVVQADPEPKPEDADKPVAEPVEVAEPTEDEGEKPADTLAPPTNWSKADKERFAELPKPAQEILVERHKAMEADYTRKTMALAELKEYEPINEMFAPFKARLRQAGQTPASMIQAWAAAEQALSNPATREDAFRYMAQQYRVDLNKLVGAAPAQQQPTQPVDYANMTEQEQLNALLNPIVKQALTPYEQKIASLEQQLAQTQQFQHGSVQAQHQQLIQAVTNEAQTFASAKDAQGNLLHPYFADVERDMAAIMKAYYDQGTALPLEEAYQRAVRANPSTYERISAQSMKAAEDKRAQEARAKSVQATRAGSSVRGGPSSGQPFTHAQGNGQDLSLRDELMASLHASQGRV